MTQSNNHKRKREREKKLNITKGSILIILIFLITILFININNIKNIYLSKITGYNKETIEVFLENNTYNEIKEQKYSQTLEKIINTQYYNQKYLKEYINIKYYEEENFLENINLLLNKGYTSTDINNINSKLNKDSINILLNNEYIKDITNIISIDYFKENNLERYIKYYQQEELDIETILTYVNIGLDKEYYTNVINIENETNIDVLVNKYHKLSENYEPSDLETISSKYGTGKLRKEAKHAFEEMCEAAKKDNITIYSGSAYRSYSYQLNLYNRYAAVDGITKTDTYSARAGYSEHQTGLAVDIMNEHWNYIENTDKEYTWLANNSYKYGFILRYPAEKETITGYMYEPWHYRYLGVKLATEISNLNLTYEEYIAKK